MRPLHLLPGLALTAVLASGCGTTDALAPSGAPDSRPTVTALDIALAPEFGAIPTPVVPDLVVGAFGEADAIAGYRVAADLVQRNHLDDLSAGADPVSPDNADVRAALTAHARRDFNEAVVDAVDSGDPLPTVALTYPAVYDGSSPFSMVQADGTTYYHPGIYVVAYPRASDATTPGVYVSFAARTPGDSTVQKARVRDDLAMPVVNRDIDDPVLTLDGALLKATFRSSADVRTEADDVHYVVTVAGTATTWLARIDGTWKIDRTEFVYDAVSDGTVEVE